MMDSIAGMKVAAGGSARVRIGGLHSFLECLLDEEIEEKIQHRHILKF